MESLQDFDPELTVESPGRINLIGEHTDYNLGYVLPTAIEKKIVFKFRKNGSKNQCRVYSLTYGTGVTIDLNKVSRSKVEWENYILGVLNELLKRTDRLTGFDCTIESNLPTGSGLSSSAALECGLAFGLDKMFKLGLSKMDIVQLSQAAEHTYVGTLCGIMDQFASVMSQEGHVILLDCRSLQYEFVPFSIDPYQIIMLNTGVSHNLASSKYNTRKGECLKGVALIQKVHPDVVSLRDVTLDMLLPFKTKMEEIIFNRCLFVAEENRRVLEMTQALKDHQLEKVGQLLYEAHHGISKRYEVSCPESDFLVEFTKKFDTVLGARQVGGGFGGCVLSLVHEKEMDAFVEGAKEAYKKEFNLQLESFRVTPSGGTLIKE